MARPTTKDQYLKAIRTNATSIEQLNREIDERLAGLTKADMINDTSAAVKRVEQIEKRLQTLRLYTAQIIAWSLEGQLDLKPDDRTLPAAYRSEDLPS
jgi:hypothetical protein